jgi:hypothetical protein
MCSLPPGVHGTSLTSGASPSIMQLLKAISGIGIF